MNRKILKNLEYIEAGLFKALHEIRKIERKLAEFPDWDKAADSLGEAIREAWNEADDMCGSAELYLDEQKEKGK